MSRFNSIATNSRRTISHEGETAYCGLDPEQQLYSITCCNILQNSYYSSTDTNIENILNLVPKCDTHFVSKLAEYLRHEMYIRSTPMVLLVALGIEGKLGASMIPAVVSRADEIKELLGAWQSISGKPSLKKIPNALKKGIAACFNKFDGYHFRKYNKQGKESISFKDVVYLTHPKPNSKEKSELFKKILDDNLDPIITWETEISAAGSDTTKKKEAWESLLLSRKLPYMAALRNIRNILTAKVSEEAVTELLRLLQDEKQILKSKQFPFRWYSAYKEIALSSDPSIMLRFNEFTRALETAISISINNIPDIDRLRKESSLIACDVSGSMFKPLSGKSSLDLVEVGVLLGKMLNKMSNRTITGVFGNDWAPIPFGSGILDGLHYPSVGLSTYGHKVIDWLIANKINIDNVMFFSDNQIYADLGINGYTHLTHYNSNAKHNRSSFEKSWNQYKRLNPTAKIYLFDLASYGTFPIDLMNKDVYMVSGWSANIFKTLGGLQNWKSMKNHILNFDLLGD